MLCADTAKYCRERRNDMLEMNNICVSFRSVRQDKIFVHSRQQVLFGVSLRVEKVPAWGFWENRAAENPQ